MTVIDYPALKAQLVALREQMRSGARAYFDHAARALFAAHPVLQGFGWRQYTPYFNDGDPCIFRPGTRLTDLDFYLGTAPLTVGEYDTFEEDLDSIVESASHYLSYKRGEGYVADDGADPERVAAILAVGAFTEVFEDDDLEQMFGEHVRVLVTREGVRIEEYDHD